MTSITEINKCIQSSIRAEKTTLKKRNISEPKYTEALAIGLPRALNNNPKLSSNIKFGGAFIHQSPLAKFASVHQQMSCELGDLLVFIRKKTKDGERFNAALVQLKRTQSPTISIKDDSASKQLFLYENWPLFYVKQLDSQYNIFPKTITKGGVYSIILEKSGVFSQIYYSAPMSSMHCDRDKTFGRFIVNMIDWYAGRTIADEHNKDADEWSRLIWDIIRYVAPKTFTGSNSQFSGQSKSTIDFLQAMLKEPLVYEDNKDGEDEPDSGFGILFVDVDERERPLEQ